jgi:hypothetical protein
MLSENKFRIGMWQVVEHLSSKGEVLSSNPSTAEKGIGEHAHAHTFTLPRRQNQRAKIGTNPDISSIPGAV